MAVSKPLICSAMDATKPLLSFTMDATKPFLSVLAFLAMAFAFAGDTLTARLRFFIWSWLAAAVPLGMATAVANREIMVRWKLVLLRGLLLLSVGLNVVPSFIALESVVDMLLFRGDSSSSSSAAESYACAVVVAAVHLRIRWVLVYGT